MTKKAPTPAEQATVSSDLVGIGHEQREFRQNVSEKMGADGVIETHIEYQPTKNSGFKKSGAGKGDKYRPVDKKRFDENYRRIFGHD